MEYRWERTFPFLEVSNATINFYIVESNNLEKKYILKIFL